MSYPNQIDKFPAKLNKKTDGSVYVMEEELPITAGKYEGLLDHDNITNTSIRVYTGSKLTGEQITNYIVSVPSETPWRRHIKVFAGVPVVYVTYETPGDTVEADDVNGLQESITATQTEVERYKTANDEAVEVIDNRLTAHVADKQNPHSVTVTQIGAETPAGAQVKADAAKTAAISAAAQDATTKANAVQANLNTHGANVTDAHNVANRLEAVRAALISYIDQSVAAIVDGAPEMLDTLYELANALGNDPNFAATMTSLIGQKLAASEVVSTATASKVLRLDASGKFPATVISQTAAYRFVTDTQIANWVTHIQLEAAGYGDMLKSIYDADNDGKVDYASVADSAGTALSLSNFSITGRSTNDLNTYRTSGMFALNNAPANIPGGSYLAGIVAANVDVGLQMVGGHNSDNLWFRGWSGSGATFYPWRSVVHSGNIGSQSVNYAATATKLATARTINGVAFDGTDNITIPITATGVTWNQLKGV
ncbi:hypothetical protein [Sporomusa sp.]|uniref:hypothetical protein n=1 Tax=Sporomusa sp. TaxID=2078658 RepID=UPI002CC257C6|nr:hypothetical protein [Sporomusa sp.]HWR07091.1 hypothetical protein [Sporomusa sp.]